MNPTRESKINGLISVKLGGMNFERQLSEKEANFWQDVVKTALRNYAQARLQPVAERNTRRDSRVPERVTK
jgi:hypothetical protein